MLPPTASMDVSHRNACVTVPDLTDIKRIQHNLQKVVPDGVSIVLGRDTDTRVFHKDTVCLIPRILDTCPSTLELNEAFRKRLKGMKVPCTIEQLVSIGVACICSTDYTVNHHTIKFLQPTQVLNIWGHIETMLASSSYELSQWLHKSVNRRSQNGYIISFHGDEGIPSFKQESNTGSRKVQAYRDITVLDYTRLPVLYDCPTTVVRAAAADSIFLSTSRVHSGMLPLYGTTFPSFP